MKNLPSRGFPELEVSDFGPIARAKVELRPMTVFAGPSNTGKSYLAILLYALHRFFGETDGSGNPFFLHGHMFQSGETQKLSGRDIRVLLQWAEETFTDDANPPKACATLAPVSDLIRTVFAEYGENAARGLCGEIGRCFGIGNAIEDLVRKGSKNGMRVVFRKPVSDDSGAFACGELAVSARGTPAFSTSIPEEMPMRLGHEDGRKAVLTRRAATDLISHAEEGAGGRQYRARRLIDALVSGQLPDVVGPLHLPAFCLPAAQTGIMRAHGAMVGALIRRAAMGGAVPDVAAPALSGFLADFLERLVSLGDGPRRRRRPPSDIGERIEKEVLRGSVRAEKSEFGYPSFTFQPEGWEAELPMTSTSSTVSELAPVVLYLKHVVLPGNTLIIEEPESHLHPATQVEFVRHLAAVVNSGVRVIITTHSEWLFEELANLVRLSELSESARKKIDGDDVALSPEQVGVWLFEPKNRPRGSIVKEIPLDEESGLFPTGFSDVAVALHNEWADISGEIGEEGKEFSSAGRRHTTQGR